MQYEEELPQNDEEYPEPHGQTYQPQSHPTNAT
jgi:hypothetical protein